MPIAHAHLHVHVALLQVPLDHLGIKHLFQALVSPNAPAHDLSTPTLKQLPQTTTGYEGTGPSRGHARRDARREGHGYCQHNSRVSAHVCAVARRGQ